MIKNRKLKNSELNRVDIDTFKSLKKSPFYIVLDDIRSLNNIGSIFRTSDAFLVKKIFLCGITACPPNKEIHKTALGATKSIEWEYVEDIHILIKKLKSQNTQLVSIEQTENSISLEDFKLNKNQTYAIIFGNEIKGIRQSVVSASNTCIEIPQFGTKHSLNISICAGIVIWDLFKKLNYNMRPLQNI